MKMPILADRATCPASRQAKRERRSMEVEDVGAEAPAVGGFLGKGADLSRCVHAQDALASKRK